MTDWNFVLECTIKIFASVLCGAVLGIERKSRNQVVGMRTLILISVSSTLLTIVSSYMSNYESLNGFAGGGDPTRLASGVVTGIGFLGGGAILRQGLNIKGLTSAAIIWTASALGLTIGAGLYIQAAIVLIVCVFLLVVLEKLEGRWFPAGRNKTLHLVFEADSLDMEKLKKTIEDTGIIITDLNMSRVMASHQIILHYNVKCPKEDDYSQLIKNLKDLGNLSEFSVTD